jgi:hypothetical protein
LIDHRLQGQGDGIFARIAGSESGIAYNGNMVTLNAHFDGKTIVLDEPFSLPLRSGTRLRVRVEAIDERPTVTPVPSVFRPLNIHIGSELSNAIALDPEFNIEET